MATDDEGGGREAEGGGTSPGPPEAEDGRADDNVLGDVPLATAGLPSSEATLPRVASAAWQVRLAALLEVVACSGLPTQVALHGLLALAGIHPFDRSGRLSTIYVFTLSIADAAVLLALVSWFLHLHGERWRSVLLGTRPVLLEGLSGILQVPIVFLLAVAVMFTVHQLAPALHDVAANPMGGLITSRQDAWLFAAVATIGGGVREEVQRAFILHRFERHLGGAALGLILFSLVFGAGHVIQGRDVALTTVALGIFWGVVYLRRRSIASTVVSHSLFNTAEIFRFAIWGA